MCVCFRCFSLVLFWSFLYKQCTSSLPLFQRNTNKQTHEVDRMLKQFRATAPFFSQMVYDIKWVRWYMISNESNGIWYQMSQMVYHIPSDSFDIIYHLTHLISYTIWLIWYHIPFDSFDIIYHLTHLISYTIWLIWYHIPFDSFDIIYHLTEEGHSCSKLFQHTINFVRLLVSVTLEKREGACALFVQKTPDMHMFTNLPSARKTLSVLFFKSMQAGGKKKTCRKKTQCLNKPQQAIPDPES